MKKARLSLLDSIDSGAQSKYQADKEAHAHLAPMATAPTLRMDELTSQRIETRALVLTTAFAKLGLIEKGAAPDTIAAALQTMETPSQVKKQPHCSILASSGTCRAF